MGALLGSILGFKFSLYRDRRAKAFSTIVAFLLKFGKEEVATNLEPFVCLLGAFLGLLRLSWEASRVKKCRQSNAKTTFL